MVPSLDQVLMYSCYIYPGCPQNNPIEMIPSVEYFINQILPEGPTPKCGWCYGVGLSALNFSCVLRTVYIHTDIKTDNRV